MRIVIATFGSLGDVHPKIALGLELRRRGHDVVFALMEFYRERIEKLGFEMFRMRPEVSPDDRQLAVEMMDAEKGTEKIITELLMPSLDLMFGDLMKAVEGADLLITGEIIYVAKSVVEKTGIKWISTSLAPISMFSAHDPSVFPLNQWYRHLLFLPVGFHRGMIRLMAKIIDKWMPPYRDFRTRLGLDPAHDPIIRGKFSDLMHLAMFSKTLAVPQPDWHRPTLQTGFCFYDGQQDLGVMPEGLEEFLDAGEPPIVFTLGSAAVMDSRDFFVESAKAAKLLGRRAILLYGVTNEPPVTGETGEWRVAVGGDPASKIAAFDYAPYSKVFERAACVVHQGGIGTTGQVLRAGVPHLIMPYSHDQPDNANRCRRIGVAETIGRDSYTAESAARKLRKILGDARYADKAKSAAAVVASERGSESAADAIESILQNGQQRLK